ncbi:MAG: tRNA threonylcarbamoyladenosine dehydratase [Akkermansiaceae bacterium]
MPSSTLSQTTIDRFGGIARLYGTPALEKFTQSHVAVIGIGGVGSWAAESLARSGIGKITMVDLDEVCVTNINRQLHAMDGEIGKQKTDAMAERIRLINPECDVICEQTFFNEKTADRLLSSGYDFVIDAIDLMMQKTFLIADCTRRNIPVVTCGGAGGKIDPTRIRVADISKVTRDALIHKVRTRLRCKFGFPKAVNYKAPKFNIEAIFFDEPAVFPAAEECDTDQSNSMRLNCASGFGSVTHMTATLGLFAAQRALNHLAK